jgi:predicted nucleotidyltransferase
MKHRRADPERAAADRQQPAPGSGKGPVPLSRIRAYTSEIARRFKPDKIILFGSYAYGRPNADSDVDLLVIMQFNPRRGRKSLEIRQSVRAGFPVDLLVRRPQDVEDRLAQGDTFLQEVTRRGRVLYEA